MVEIESINKNLVFTQDNIHVFEIKKVEPKTHFVQGYKILVTNNEIQFNSVNGVNEEGQGDVNTRVIQEVMRTHP